MPRHAVDWQEMLCGHHCDGIAAVLHTGTPAGASCCWIQQPQLYSLLVKQQQLQVREQYQA
jgi:hypothetical protein